MGAESLAAHHGECSPASCSGFACSIASSSTSALRVRKRLSGISRLQTDTAAQVQPPKMAAAEWVIDTH